MKTRAYPHNLWRRILWLLTTPTRSSAPPFQIGSMARWSGKGGVLMA